MKKTILCCLLLVLICACVPLSAHAEEGYTLLVATDPHYIAPGLTDHGMYFTALTENADGKLMHYSEEIMDAFLAEAVAQQPEALIQTAFPEFVGWPMDGLAGFRGNELLYACNVRDDGCNGYVIIRNDAPYYSTLSIICENGLIREINFECLGSIRANGIFQ